MEIVATNVYTWIEAIVEELNKCINYNIIQDKTYNIEFRVLPVTFINRDKMVKNLADLYSRGKGSLQAWIASIGMNADDYLSLMDFELAEDFEKSTRCTRRRLQSRGKTRPIMMWTALMENRLRIRAVRLHKPTTGMQARHHQAK